MYIFIFFSLIYLINFLFNKLSKVEDINSGNDNYKVYYSKDKIEIGFPNHNYNNDQLKHFDEDDDQSDTHNEQIYTKNMFVESHYELNLSLFERDLTVKMVNDAYEKILNEHLDKITKGIPDIFNIKEKQDARDYLLNKINKDTKS
jgi:hypothetical protein